MTKDAVWFALDCLEFAPERSDGLQDCFRVWVDGELVGTTYAETADEAITSVLRMDGLESLAAIGAAEGIDAVRDRFVCVQLREDEINDAAREWRAFLAA